MAVVRRRAGRPDAIAELVGVGPAHLGLGVALGDEPLCERRGYVANGPRRETVERQSVQFFLFWWSRDTYTH
jgi:hypothetical protein